MQRIGDKHDSGMRQLSVPGRTGDARQSMASRASRRSMTSNKRQIEDDVFSDEDDAKKQEKQAMRQMQRFGHEIQDDRFKVSNFLRIFSILLAILIIPLQIFMKTKLQQEEDRFIKKW